MLAKIFSGTTIGLDGVLIEVEVDVASSGFPTFTIVGLPNKAVDEAKDRVRTALTNASFEMPDSRLTVNLAPADIPKEGSGFDLPIAIGILVASGALRKDALKDSFFIGELSLEGQIRKVHGIISIALMAKKHRITKLFVPRTNSIEARLTEGIEVYAADSLTDLVFHLNGHAAIAPLPPLAPEDLFQKQEYEFDFSEIRGQTSAKRALEIAAAGMHNVHLKGPPGTGKTLLSRAFPSILPPLEKDEIVEVSKIYSIAGLLADFSFITIRPFRSPHHTTSRIGLIGGGTHPAPGEITLAHKGVLFLDELAEFPRSVLEALRQPLEDGMVSISRAAGSILFPSRFLLLAASNPCPCGYLGHPKRTCRCMPGTILKYRKRLSGPLLDRIDIHVDVPPVEEKNLIDTTPAETSENIRKRVIRAHERQRRRFAHTRVRANGHMSSQDTKKFCSLTDEATNILKQAISQLSLSARAYFKIIKIAQTVADLSGAEKIEAYAIAEALHYRPQEE